jgi:sulfur dioxygenase
MAYRVNGDRVLTGDVLFIRGCGRTDFEGDDAGILFDSMPHQ